MAGKFVLLLDIVEFSNSYGSVLPVLPVLPMTYILLYHSQDKVANVLTYPSFGTSFDPHFLAKKAHKAQ